MIKEQKSYKKYDIVGGEFQLLIKKEIMTKRS